MYSWEIEKFINDRNYHIGGDDLEFIIDPKNHSQYIYVTTKGPDGRWVIYTNDGYKFEFWPIPIEEAKAKGLVKKIIKNKETSY